MKISTTSWKFIQKSGLGCLGFSLIPQISFATSTDVKITIDDEGPGIPENKLDAIFERFYSERPAAEKFGLHSGLGLSICKQIIEAHNGKISAENRRDYQNDITGAQFVITLPIMNKGEL